MNRKLEIREKIGEAVEGLFQPLDEFRHGIRMNIFSKIGLLTGALLEHFNLINMDEIRKKKKGLDLIHKDNTGG
jgi:hypothetical protein